MRIEFVFAKLDNSKLILEYEVMNNAHSKLWAISLEDFCKSNSQVNSNRVYNFIDHETEIKLKLDECNKIINELNNVYNLSIPCIKISSLQEDVNYAHTFFTESNRQQTDDNFWYVLNDCLHGLEIISRRKGKGLQGQVFYNLPNATRFDIPAESFSSFTTKKQFGYCYANYPHVGRHVFEMFNAKDEDAHNEDVIPMHKIAGDGYLWFSRNTSIVYDFFRKLKIKKWYKENHLENITGLKWGDPSLAIGWLPVAKLATKTSRKELDGVVKLVSIKIV